MDKLLLMSLHDKIYPDSTQGIPGFASDKIVCEGSSAGGWIDCL